jgi:putative ABC transport system permease protein
MDGFLSDLRASMRELWRDRAFTAVAVLTLALGTGATVAVFGMANQLLLRPLPGVTEPEAAAYLQFGPADPSSFDLYNPRGLSQPDFDEVRRSATLLAGIASTGGIGAQASAEGGRPIALRVATAYGHLFEVIGASAAEGRLFTAAETALDADPNVIVITEDLRARLFGSTESVVGRTIRVNEHPMSVIGVVGGGFAGIERGDPIDAWVPHGALVPLAGFTADRLSSRESTMHGRNLIVRPRPGVSPAAAQAELDAILSRLARTVPADDREYVGNLRARLYPGLGVMPASRDRVRSTLRTLALMAALALAIACANVANLLLFRGVLRRGDVAVRRALGASAGRIARQQFLQSTWLAALGIAGGLMTAWALMLAFRGEAIRGAPAFEGFAFDGRVLGFAVLGTAVTALLFGALPAALAGRLELKEAMGAPRSAGTRGFSALRSGLAAGQLALALTLVVGALLLTRTLLGLYAADTGYSIERVVEVRLESPRDMQAEAMPAFQEQLMAAVGAVPGVEAVAFDVNGPHSRITTVERVSLVGIPESEFSIGVNHITPSWFSLLDVKLVDGRPLADEDVGAGAPARAVVTAALARRMFNRTDVAGQRIVVGRGARARETEIVGVTRDLSDANEPDRPLEAVYLPFGRPGFAPALVLLARVDGESGATPSLIREALEAALPDKAIADPTPLMARVDATHSERRIFARLLELLAGFAIALAAVGLYAVISFGVATRRREFGIRLALGAQKSSVAELVARHAVGVLIMGGIAGLYGAFALSELLSSRLYGVTSVDPASWLAGAALLVVAVAGACVVPTLRAVRVDAATTLREE